MSEQYHAQAHAEITNAVCELVEKMNGPNDLDGTLAYVAWIADEVSRLRADRYCATCNEPEFSEYAVNCRAHTDDNMIEA